MQRRDALSTLAALGGAAAVPAGGFLAGAAGCAPARPPVSRRSETALVVRRSAERGHASRGWLDSYHSFSFADYHDPAHMGFRHLRVINEDRIAPSGGFPMHPHRDMEIVTYVLDGALEHRDSMGNGSVIRPGEVQRMSAGTGIRHSEFNASSTRGVHLLQIWLLPGELGIAPSYEQKAMDRAALASGFRVVASPTGESGSVTIRTDARIAAAVLAKGQRIADELGAGRHAWLQVARGAIRVNGVELARGDAAATGPAGVLDIEAREPAELLRFDLG